MKAFNGYVKGINLGGWISQCGNNYNDEHYSTFITKDDIKNIASLGFDHVRLPIDYNVIQNDDGSFIESGFKYIDNCLEWCEEYKLNVVLDLHKVCGFVFDREGGDFFSDEKLQEMFYALWIEMAKRYGKVSNAVFELLNEVTEPQMAKPWNAIIKKVVPMIREYAPDKKIIAGGIYNSSIVGLTLMDEPVDKNMVYTFHCYSPFVFTHQSAGWLSKMPKDYHVEFPTTVEKMKEESHSVFGSDFDTEFEGLESKMVDKEYFKKMFQTAVDVANKYDIPLYCGEYGVIDYADADSTLSWFKEIHAAFEEMGLSRAVWTYKYMDFGLTDEHYKDIFEELIKTC